MRLNETEGVVLIPKKLMYFWGEHVIFRNADFKLAVY